LLKIIPILNLLVVGNILGLMVFVILKNFKTPIGKSIIVMCITYVIWSLGIYSIITEPVGSARVIAHNVSSFGWAFFPVSFIAFIMFITHNDLLQKIRMMLTITISLGVVFVISCFVDPGFYILSFALTPFGWTVIKPLYSPFLAIYSAYMLATYGICSYYLIKWRKTTRYNQERHQASLLFASGSIMFFLTIITDLILPVLGVAIPSMVPVFSMVWFYSLFYSTLKYKMLDIPSNISADEILSRIEEMLFLLDDNGGVVQMNIVARNNLGYFVEDIPFLTFEKIFPIFSKNLKTEGKYESEEIITQEGTGIPVNVTISPRYNQYGDLIGYIAIAKDLRVQRALEKNKSKRIDAELKLNDQTIAFRMMMNNASQGFLYFDENLRIKPEHNELCLALLESDKIDGCDIIDALLPTVQEEEKKAIRSVLANIFEEEHDWKLDALIALMPSNTVLKDHQLSMQYKLVQAEGGINKVVMVILTDCTETKYLENRLSDENSRLSMVVAVMTNRQGFFELLDEYQHYFEVELPFPTVVRTPTDAVYELYRNVHTFKGSFLRFSLKLTCQQLMFFEDLLSEIMKGEITVDKYRMLAKQCDYKEWIRNDMDILARVIGNDFMKTKDRVEIDREVLENLALEFENHIQGAECIALMKRFREIYCMHAKKVLMMYGSYIHGISKERGLMPPTFSVQGGDVLLDGTFYRQFFRSLVHIFNNIVAHGIESSEMRIRQAKPERARIECRIDRRGDMFFLEIADDGQGINIEKLRRESVIKKILNEESVAAMSDYDVLQLIFKPGFSTVMVADNISGRGIGLFAVAHTVKQLGGIVKVQSKFGYFTRFQFEMPMTLSNNEKP
jgi:PAS domain-containing protein